MANKEHSTAAQIITALETTKGMMYLAAKRLGCSYQTLVNYCKRYPTIQMARDAQRGEMIDAAELVLWNSIHAKEPWAITFTLRTIGKDRGYIERQEVTGEDGHAVVIRVVYEEPQEQAAQKARP